MHDAISLSLSNSIIRQVGVGETRAGEAIEAMRFPTDLGGDVVRALVRACVRAVDGSRAAASR